jgi:hypothetical protein
VTSTQVTSLLEVAGGFLAFASIFGQLALELLGAFECPFGVDVLAYFGFVWFQESWLLEPVVRL